MENQMIIFSYEKFFAKIYRFTKYVLSFSFDLSKHSPMQLNALLYYYFKTVEIYWGHII